MITNRFIEPSESEVLDAVKSQNYVLVENYLLNKQQGKNGQFYCKALHVAVEQNDLRMVTLLLKFDVALTAREERTPIELAARLGYWECVIVIAKKYGSHKSPYKYTCGHALRIAAENNLLPVVKELLSIGVSPNVLCLNTLNSPLHYAVKNRNLEMVLILIKYGAKLVENSADRENPFALAARLNFWDAVIVLAKILKNNCIENTGPAILYAAKANDYSRVKAMFNDHATLEKDKETENNALHYAAIHNNVAMLQFFLRKKHFNYGSNDKNVAGDYPINIAANNKYWRCFWILAENKNCSRGAYLVKAVKSNQYKIAKMLLAAGADILQQDKSEHYLYLESLLHYAVANNNPTMVALLLLHKANPHYRNRKGETPLMTATALGFHACVKAFKEPHKYINIEKIVAILFSAHGNSLHFLFRLPHDVFRLILDAAFGNFSPDIYNYPDAINTYITLRPARDYVIGVSRFVKSCVPPKSHSIGLFQHKEDQAEDFVKRLKATVNEGGNVQAKAEKCRHQIEEFSSSQTNKNSRVMRLLTEHNLYKPVGVAPDDLTTNSIWSPRY